MKNRTYTAEIQVRTVFEEAWSEIDHNIRYPYDIDNPILAGYLVMFNTLSGNADEMGTFIKFLKNELDERKRKLHEKDRTILELREKIVNLEIEHISKENLLENIDRISHGNEDNINQDFISSVDWMPSIGSILKLDSDVVKNLGELAHKLASTLDEDALAPVFNNMNSNVLTIAEELAKNFDKIQPILEKSDIFNNYPTLTDETTDTIKAIMDISSENKHEQKDDTNEELDSEKIVDYIKKS